MITHPIETDVNTLIYITNTFNTRNHILLNYGANQQYFYHHKLLNELVGQMLEKYRFEDYIDLMFIANERIKGF